jgi:signal peptidase I
MTRVRMIALAWQELKGLVLHPMEALEGVLARHGFVVSLVLGAMGYYWSTLQISELLTPSPLGEVAYFLINCPVALGRMAVAVTLIHLACWFVVRGGGGWRELLSIWGYTQVPTIILTGLAVTSFATAPSPERSEVWLLWLLSVVGLALLLSLWGLILRLQAIRLCYHVEGRQLLACIVVALAFNGAFAWLEKMLLDDRGLVPSVALRAMDGGTSVMSLGRKNLALPFDILTYHLRPPARGEIVGFLPSGRGGGLPLIQSFWLRSVGRIVGLPGDKVEVKEGRLLIDDQPAGEPYRHGPIGINLPQVTVPAGHFFVLGDNRAVPLETYGGGIVPGDMIRGRLTHVGRLKWRLTVGTWLW